MEPEDEDSRAVVFGPQLPPDAKVLYQAEQALYDAELEACAEAALVDKVLNTDWTTLESEVAGI